VDNSPNLVDKARNRVCGMLRHAAAVGGNFAKNSGLTRTARLNTAALPNGAGPGLSLASAERVTPEAWIGPEQLPNARHGQLSEHELLEGYGMCGRCSGFGHVLADEVHPDRLRSVSCPSCGGTGRKGGGR
jgi:hypothetical protein